MRAIGGCCDVSVRRRTVFEVATAPKKMRSWVSYITVRSRVSPIGIDLMGT